MKKECEDCGKCCLETDMIVSEQDLGLILNNNSLGNLRKKDFTFRNKEGYVQLKNIAMKINVLCQRIIKLENAI